MIAKILQRLGQSELSYDPDALIRCKVEGINKTEGDLTGYDCPKCRNKGYVAQLRDSGHRYVTVECDCMRIRRCVKEMERSGLSATIRECTFDSFQATEDWQKIIKQKAMDYGAKPQGWLLLCGQSGSGKTHLCTAVCRQRLLSGEQVRYMPWRDEVAQLKALAMEQEQRQSLMRELKTADLLYIDDLFKTGRASDGSCNPTAADVSIAFELLNARCINRLPTVISTEKLPAELVQIDEATGSRIIQMAHGHTVLINRDQRRNYRLRDIVEV